MTAGHIDRIELDNVAPEVFVADGATIESSVWRRRLAFTRGTNYCINAASGTGKTSLCSFIYGARTDYDGTIRIDGDDVRPFSVERWSALRRSNLAYMPQELGLFDSLTALENVLLKNRLTDFCTEAEIRCMFASLAIDHRADTPAGRLSVGQKQRVALIRAVCQPFDFLLLDEPVSHLDPASNAACGLLAASAARRVGASVIFTSVGHMLSFPEPYQSLQL